MLAGMFDFTEEQKMMRKMLRRWVEAELVPHVDALESEQMLPYEPMRKFIATFGVADMVRQSFAKAEARAAGGGDPATSDSGVMRDPAMSAITAIEFCRVSPGFSMAFGASL